MSDAATTSDLSGRPRPAVNPWARPFWDGARDGKLLIQRCRACEKAIFYPRIACPHCGADDLAWQQACGLGSIYSYTVVLNNAPSAFLREVPYVVAVIRLEEGVQMLSNIVECDAGRLACDMPVEVTFRRIDDEFTLPLFRPADPALRED